MYKVVLTLKFCGWNLHRGHLYSKMPTFILLIENIKKALSLENMIQKEQSIFFLTTNVVFKDILLTYCIIK